MSALPLQLFSVGQFTIRSSDIPYAVMVTYCLWKWPHLADGAVQARMRRAGPRAILILTLWFAAAVLGSTTIVLVAHRSDGVAAVAASLRTMQTISIGLLAAILIRYNNRDTTSTWITTLLVGELALLGAISVVFALQGLGIVESFVPAKSFIGPLAVLGVYLGIAPSGTVPRRVAAALTGLVILWLLASITALAVLTFTAPLVSYAVIRATTARPRVTSAAMALGVGAACVVFSLSALQTVRPTGLPAAAPRPGGSSLCESAHHHSAGNVENPGNDEVVCGSTILHRTILMWTASQLFLEHPLGGVGWTRSALPKVVGEPALVKRAKARFPDAYPSLFPDVYPSGAHNAVLHAFAELGLLGGVPFAFLLICSLLGALRALLAGGKRKSTPAAVGMLCAVSMMVISLGFLATDGIYPDQPATVFLAFGLGAASVSSD